MSAKTGMFFQNSSHGCRTCILLFQILQYRQSGRVWQFKARAILVFQPDTGSAMALKVNAQQGTNLLSLMKDLQPFKTEAPMDSECQRNGWPRWGHPLCSPANLQAFIRWAESSKTDATAIRLVLRQVCILHHAGPGGVPPEKITLRRTKMFIRGAACDLQPCKRCDDQQGGYMFPFIDPRWTGENFLVKELNMPQAMGVITKEGPGPRLDIMTRSSDIFDTEHEWIEARMAATPGPCSDATNKAARDIRMKMAKDTAMEGFVASGIEKATVLVPGIGMGVLEQQPSGFGLRQA